MDGAAPLASRGESGPSAFGPPPRSSAPGAARSGKGWQRARGLQEGTEGDAHARPRSQRERKTCTTFMQILDGRRMRPIPLRRAPPRRAGAATLPGYVLSLQVHEHWTQR